MLLQIALAPTILLAFFIYIKDKFEKEPVKILVKTLIGGIIIILPIWYVEKYLGFLMPILGKLEEAFYISFIIAAFTEEVFKFLAVYLIAYKDINFNEPFDGIAYSVFVALGFATVENIMYVFNPVMGGVETAVGRAIFSVPGHVLFGVMMGYELGLSKFCKRIPKVYFRRAIFIPIVFHGIYDFILLSYNDILMLSFIPFVIYMWIKGVKKMRAHQRISPFNPNMIEATEEEFERLHPHK